MHKLAEKIAKCLEAKVEGMGIDNIEGQNLVEFELWSKIAKNLVCYDKDKKIIEAMEESEDAKEAMKYIEMYEHYPEEERKGYRGQPRDSKGRYMSRRKGYDEPMGDYEMTPEMYRMYSPEYYRDMDRDAGKMYYTSNSSSGNMSSQGGSMGGNSMTRDSREGRNGQSRRSYMETKEMHKGNTPEDKEAKRKELDKWMTDIGSDIKELVHDMSTEEKQTAKTKLTNLANSLV